MIIRVRNMKKTLSVWSRKYIAGTWSPEELKYFNKNG
jgi:hypothetical protein